MAFAKSVVPAFVAVALLAQGCAPTPTEPDPQPAEGEQPEITLNLPEAQQCDCGEQSTRDYTFLDKGFSALSRGEYGDAMEYFQRYRRLESSAAARWEADIAVAYLRAIPESSLHDADEARKSYRDLRKEDWQSMELHSKTLLMRQSLETFLQMERENRELAKTNRGLKEDLEKREEALKRLRELTLGQTGSAQ